MKKTMQKRLEIPFPMRDTFLETHGPVDIGLEFFGGVYRDHLFAHIDRSGEISMQVDDYHPEPEKDWDVEQWEANSCYLRAKATRENWRFVYLVGRALCRHGKITLCLGGRDSFEVCCDGTELTFNCT